MKDLQKLADECKADLLSIGIQPQTVSRWIVNTRAKCRWGLCHAVQPGIYEISIAACLLQDDVDVQSAKDTIMHELLHTVKGCRGHKGLWKELAGKVNRRLPQYTIKRTTGYSEKGIEPPQKTRTNKYAVQCEKCGSEIAREKLSKVIQYPDKYRCAICGGTLKRIR